MKKTIFGCFELKPIGRVWAAMDDVGLCSIAIGGSETAMRRLLSPEFQWVRCDKKFVGVAKAIDGIIRGQNVTSPKIHISVGTKFQRRVWSEIAKIPFGKTISYSELAKNAGNSRAVRAAASACGKNPLPLIIPCHRVVAKSGIGGFSCGIEMKKILLRIETQSRNV